MQEESLFEEMRQIKSIVSPNEIVFVMDGSIGQALTEQADAFKKAVDVGSVIITKLDGHAKGGGALSAVASTGAPICFLGTGEGFEDLEPFDPESFIKRLLGLGDLSSLMKTVQTAINPDTYNTIQENIMKGKFPMRSMRDQYKSVLNMGSLSSVVSMIPGMNSNVMSKD